MGSYIHRNNVAGKNESCPPEAKVVGYAMAAGRDSGNTGTDVYSILLSDCSSDQQGFPEWYHWDDHVAGFWTPKERHEFWRTGPHGWQLTAFLTEG